MDGVFSKILYSNQYFTMNGIYVLYRPLFCESSTEKTTPKYIERLCDIEKYILDVYSNTMLTSDNIITYEDKSSLQVIASPLFFTKSPIYVFKNQLCGGHYNTAISQGRIYGISRTSITYEDKSSTKHSHIDNVCVRGLSENGLSTQYIKISGVWETDCAYGITYKVIKG